MISDHYKITGPELRSQGARRIGDDDRPASGRHSRPYRMGDGHGRVPLVEVKTAEEGQNLQITDLERPDLWALMGHDRRRESRQFAQIVPGRDGTDAGGSVRQPSTEDHGYIVVTDPTHFSQSCGC